MGRCINSGHLKGGRGFSPIDMPLRDVSSPQPSTPNTGHTVQPPDVFRWEAASPRYHMQDLILDTATAEQLLDAISYFQNRDLLFDHWGLSERFASSDGLAVNLYGPPGTGKTMAAHAISDALHKPMICVDYAEIESKYVGETSKNLVRLFQTANEQGAVIFFDEALRERLWKTYIPSKMPCQVDPAVLARKFANISGSDIANAVFSAAVGAARDGEQVVSQSRFETAIQRCLAVKEANRGEQVTVTKRIISAEEARQKLGNLE